MDANERYLSIIARLHQPAVAERLVFAESVDSDVAAVEERLGIRLPDAYTRLLCDRSAFSIRTVGKVTTSNRYDMRFLAATLEGNDSIVAVTNEARMGDPPLPRYLIPFFMLTIGVGQETTDILTCFDYNQLSDGEPTVVTTGNSFGTLLGSGSTKTCTFLDWLNKRVHELEQPLHPPRMPSDWDLDVEWDTYWQETIKDRIWREEEEAHSSHMVFRGINWLREQGVRRILLAGNGISLEGHALAHMGFDVTALDISPRACGYVESFALEPRHLARFLPAYRLMAMPENGGEFYEFCEEKSLERVAREARPGGSLHVIVADMFDFTPKEQFDLVVTNRSIQGFSQERRQILARRMWDWVRPGGLCIVETMNLCMRGNDLLIEKDFKAAGFIKRTWEWETEQSPRNRKRGKPNLALAAIQAQPVCLATGEKMVMFSHS